MAKPIKNITGAVGDILGVGGSIEMPKVAPAPPTTPAKPVKAEEQEDLMKSLKRPGRVSSETSAVTGARGVLTDAPIAYKSLLGGKKKQ